MEAAGVDRLGELQRTPGAGDVRLLHRLGTGLDVVHGAEVIEVLDLALQLRDVGLAHAELRQAEVALDRNHALAAVRAPELAQLVELAERLRPHQHVDRSLAAREQRLHQETANETGRAGHKIIHKRFLFASSRLRSEKGNTVIRKFR